VQDPGGAVCQIQQRIYTQGSGGGVGLGDRQCQVNRALAHTIAGRLITASIDEGIEFDGSEGSAPAGAGGAGGSVCSSVERLTLESMRLVARVPDAPVHLQSSHASTVLAGCLARQFANFDSTVEAESLSNLSSSFGSLGSSASAGDETEECMRTTDDDQYLASSSEAAPGEHEAAAEPQVEFSEGRRASDGIMAHGIHAFHQQFKAAKSRGIPEMRKELERFRLEASAESGDTSKRRAFKCRVNRGGQGQSLDDDGALSSSPQRSLLSVGRRVPPPPNAELHRLMATCHQYHPLSVVRPCRPATDYQAYQQLHQQLPSCFQRLLIDGSAARPSLSMTDDRVLPRGGAAARALYSSIHPAFSTTRSRDCSPNNPTGLGPPRATAASPPTFVPLGYGGRASGGMYVGMRPRGAVDPFFVPTCRSHDSLAVAAIPDPSNCESTSLEALVGRHHRHTMVPPGTTGGAAASSHGNLTVGFEGSRDEGIHRHMVRRTLFRLVQQQTLASPSGDEDYVERSLQQEHTRGAESSRSQPS